MLLDKLLQLFILQMTDEGRGIQKKKEMSEVKAQQYPSTFIVWFKKITAVIIKVSL